MNKEPLGIYIHIPFCEKKCAYCDFLSGPSTRQEKNEYMEALKTEIQGFQKVYETYKVVSIFFGGGTPSSIDATEISSTLHLLKETFHIEDLNAIEVTIETNPGTLTKEKLLTYKEAGVNRISIGLQSTHNSELKLLGRIHTYQQFTKNYELVKEVGFTNINIDLMSALPGQTKETYEETLRRVVALSPSHISAYSLIVEEDTPFYEEYKEGGKGYSLLPSEDVDREMYGLTKEILAKHGYHRYEISNYAKEGKECIHNSLYWTGVSYLGFGVGASSYFEGVRYRNVDGIREYIEKNKLKQSIIEEKEILSKTEQMEEFMFLGLRMIKGVSKEEFRSRFGRDIYEVYGKILTTFYEEGLLKEEKERIFLTEQGLDVSNYVMSEFLL